MAMEVATIHHPLPPSSPTPAWTLAFPTVLCPSIWFQRLFVKNTKR